MTDQEKRHVFISYVRENQDQVDQLCQDLESHGVNVWLDRNSIKPGARWKSAIQEAIRNGNFFIACFSDEYTSKTKSYMNEELTLAIEELRQYSSDQEWFIPVLLSECDVPARSIGAGETLLDINWVPLYEDWDAGIQRILSVIKPLPPEIQNLISALRSEERDVHKQAAWALERMGEEGLPVLIETLKDKEIHVRRTSAITLGAIGPKAKTAVPALVEVLRDEVEDVRDYAIQALWRIGPEAKTAVPALIEMLKDEVINFRMAAARALGNIGPEAKAAVPHLIEALKDENRDFRSAAALALGKIGPEAKAALPILINALKNMDKDFCESAVSALGGIGPAAKTAVPFIIKSLRCYNTDIYRSAAASALAGIHNGALPPFIEMLKDRNRYVRETAVIALADFDPKANPILIEALNDKAKIVRMAAAGALGNIGPEAKAATPALIQALEDQDEEVRWNAVWALEQINTPEAQKALEEYKKKSD